MLNMKTLTKSNYWLWLIIISIVVSGLFYTFGAATRANFESKITYTVVPKTAVLKGNYQDLQASNLFIDVVKAWLYSPAIQAELKENINDAIFSNFRSTSMQTFEITILAENQEQAKKGAEYLGDIIKREVDNHAKISGNGGYLISDSDITELETTNKNIGNTVLVFLITLIIGTFLILLFTFKPKY
ncbi:MAG: hypothetical protein U9M89_00400 [Patescibacteria group bacterium]|nr:hypothetical protein [Patescibacteria group bacterium]